MSPTLTSLSGRYRARISVGRVARMCLTRRILSSFMIGLCSLCWLSQITARVFSPGCRGRLGTWLSEPATTYRFAHSPIDEAGDSLTILAVAMDFSFASRDIGIGLRLRDSWGSLSFACTWFHLSAPHGDQHLPSKKTHSSFEPSAVVRCSAVASRHAGWASTQAPTTETRAHAWSRHSPTRCDTGGRARGFPQSWPRRRTGPGPPVPRPASCSGTAAPKTARCTPPSRPG